MTYKEKSNDKVNRSFRHSIMFIVAIKLIFINDGIHLVPCTYIK